VIAVHASWVLLPATRIVAGLVACFLIDDDRRRLPTPARQADIDVANVHAAAGGPSQETRS
jgi:hypothetical protein